MTSEERKASNKYVSYLMSRKYNLYDAYGRFSQEKAEAWEYCEELKKKKNGKGLKVIGANTCFFSAGFLYEEDGEERFMYITKGGDYSCKIKEAI